jgi:hypothetical protein
LLESNLFVLSNLLWTVDLGDWFHEEITDQAAIKKTLSDVLHICLTFCDYESKGSIMIDNIRLLKGKPNYY